MSDNNVMRHRQRRLTDKEMEYVTKVKDAGLVFYNLCTEIGTNRELSLAKANIEQAVMWATKGVSR